MKKLNILLFSAAALGFVSVSCSKNEEEKPSIVAKWKFDTLSHTQSGETSAAEPYNNASCTDANFLDIKAGGILEQQVVGSSTDPCAVSKVDGTYTFENEIIHLVQDGNEVDLAVMSLTNKALQLKMINPDDESDFYTFTFVK